MLVRGGAPCCVYFILFYFILFIYFYFFIIIFTCCDFYIYISGIHIIRAVLEVLCSFVRSSTHSLPTVLCVELCVQSLIWTCSVHSVLCSAVFSLLFCCVEDKVWFPIVR